MRLSHFKQRYPENCQIFFSWSNLQTNANFIRLFGKLCFLNNWYTVFFFILYLVHTSNLQSSEKICKNTSATEPAAPPAPRNNIKLKFLTGFTQNNSCLMLLTCGFSPNSLPFSSIILSPLSSLSSTKSNISNINLVSFSSSCMPPTLTKSFGQTT